MSIAGGWEETKSGRKQSEGIHVLCRSTVYVFVCRYNGVCSIYMQRILSVYICAGGYICILAVQTDTCMWVRVYGSVCMTVGTCVSPCLSLSRCQTQGIRKNKNSKIKALLPQPKEAGKNAT